MPWLPMAVAAAIYEAKAGISLLGSGHFTIGKFLAATSLVGSLYPKGGEIAGVATATRNPIAPWNVVYGRARVGGTLIYLNSFGDDDKWLDMVFVLACHPCESVDALLFDMKPIQIDTTHYYTGDTAPTSAPVNTSFSPVQQDIQIRDIRKPNDTDGSPANVITVTLQTDIPLLQDGDKVIIGHRFGGGYLDVYRWTGTFPVKIVGRNIYSSNIGATAALVFTYLCSGDNNPMHTGPFDNEGDVHTAWADYGRKVYMESMLGDQTLGETFYGMMYGTPEDGDPGTLALTPSGDTNNPWTTQCSLVGRTAVFLRLHYNDAIFANGLPQISFLVHGKKDILDPRNSPPTRGYSENAALCNADYPIRRGDSRRPTAQRFLTRR